MAVYCPWSVQRGAIVRVLAAALIAANVARATEWIGGTGDWFEPENWDGGVPTVSDWVQINGGTAQASGEVNTVLPIEVRDLNVGSMYPFDPASENQTALSGHFVSTNVDVHVVRNVNVAVNKARGTGPDSTLASLSIADGDLTIGGQMILGHLMGNVWSSKPNATVDGSATVGGKVVGSGVFSAGDLLAIGYLTDDLGDMRLSSASGTMTVRDGVFDVGNIIVGVAPIGGWRDDDPATVRGELFVERGGMTFLADGGQLTVGRVLGLAQTAEAIVDVTGPIAGFDQIIIASGWGGPNTRAHGQLIARDSVVSIDADSTTPALDIAFPVHGTEDVTGVFELSPGLALISNVSGPGLRVGDAGKIVLHIHGDTRANPTNVERIYSAVNVDDARLDGVIVADFDYRPQLGSHTYDLVVARSIDALTSSMEAANFQVQDLPIGFEVDSFGIQEVDFGEGPVDVVRLTISEAPLLAGDASADFRFDQLDIVQVLIRGRYLTGSPATWGDGDWNGAPGGNLNEPPTGDGIFDQLDIQAALQTNDYLPYSVITGGSLPTSETSIMVVNSPVTEPDSVLLLCIGLYMFVFVRYRRNRG